jgi:hypothetical protein
VNERKAKVMIREGDVYTCDFYQKQEKRIRACYRPFIIVDIKDDVVFGIPLTTKVSNFEDEKCVYTSMTVNEITKKICILAYIEVKIQKKDLIKKIAHVDGHVLKRSKYVKKEVILENKSNISYGRVISNHRDTMFKESQPKAGSVHDENQDIKDALHIFNYKNSSKNIWWERIISFVSGLLEAVLASLILRTCKFD